MRLIDSSFYSWHGQGFYDVSYSKNWRKAEKQAFAVCAGGGLWSFLYFGTVRGIIATI
jgi:hypothetical protein